MCSQRDRPDETAPMSTQNTLKWMFDRYIGIYLYALQTLSTGMGMKSSSKICVVGSEQNHLYETAPMSTQNNAKADV